MIWRQCDTHGDWAPVVDALIKLEAYAKEYKWAVGVDFSLATGAIYTAIKAGQGYIIDGYLVMLDEVKPWYSDEPILTEWLVMKLYPGGSVDSIPPALVQIAKQRGLKLVMTADSSPVNIVAGAYKRGGFSPLTTSFYKAV
jgi:hypothetical protein